MKIIILAWYFGLGCLAHWLWIGSHLDVSDVFTWVCLLLGPPMVIAWIAMKAVWWFVVVAIVVVVLAFVIAFGDEVLNWKRRRDRRREVEKTRRRMSSNG